MRKTKQSSHIDNRKNVCHLMALCMKPLEDLFEAVQAGLAQPVEGVGSFHPAEVGGPVAARGVEYVRLAGHILHHEVLPL